MRYKILAGSALLAFTLTGCATSEVAESSHSPQGVNETSPAVSGPIRIGTGLTPETSQVAHIYAEALEEAGYTVELVPQEGSRAHYFATMQLDPASVASSPPGSSGLDPKAVHITPDLTGDLLLYLTDNGAVSPTIIEAERAQAQASATPSTSGSAVQSDNLDAASISPSPAPSLSPGASVPSPSATNLNVRGLLSNDIVTYLDRALPDTAEVLAPSAAVNRYGYAMTRAKAQEHSIAGMRDLTARTCSDLTLVAPSWYGANPSGQSSLAEYYFCEPQSLKTAENTQEQVEQLVTGQVDMAYVYSASAQLGHNNLLLLDDPEGTQLAQQIIPVVRAGELPQQVQDIINDVSGQLDTDSLIRLNTLTSGEQAISEKEAAHFWLTTLKG